MCDVWKEVQHVNFLASCARRRWKQNRLHGGGHLVEIDIFKALPGV